MTTAPAQGYELSLRGRVAVVGCSTKLRSLSKTSFHPLCFTCKSQEKREPTSGLEPLTCSLRVITQALQRVARSCKSCIFRGVSLLRLAPCCTVLRSRWYQDERQLQSDSRSNGTHSRPSEPQSADPRF